MSVTSDGEDSYECEECGAFYHTILPRWKLPSHCWQCNARNPWELVPDVPVPPVYRGVGR